MSALTNDVVVYAWKLMSEGYTQTVAIDLAKKAHNLAQLAP